MASVRFSQRLESAKPRSPMILNNETAFNQLEQVVPIHGKRRSSENRTQYSNLTDWYYSPPKSIKKNTRSIDPSERSTSKSLSILSQRRPGSSGTALSNSQMPPLMENNTETLDPNRYRISSAVTSHSSLSNQNQQRIESTYPKSIFIGPRTLDQQCSSSVTMRYRSDPNLSAMSHNSRRDEVTIFQVANNGSTWIVFKGFLQVDDSFTFKSQRSVDDRFHLKLEINGSLDTTISACCEHLYRHGGRIDDGDSSFWIETVEEYTSCAKCRESIDLSQPHDSEIGSPAEVLSKSSHTSKPVRIPVETLLDELESKSITSEESNAEESQSDASEKPPETKHASPTMSSTDLSSSFADAKKVPEKPVATSKVQSFPPPPSVSHQHQVTAVLPSPPPPPPSTVHSTAPQKDPSVSVSEVQVKPADYELNLFKYVNDIMQQALSKPNPSETIPPRRIGNVENFTILYIDPNEERDLSLLRPTVNFIRILNDPNTLGTLLAACTDEKLIVVMSLDQAEALLPELQQHKCVQSIYFLSEQTHLPKWISDYDKVIDIYQNIESIRDHLIQTLPHVASQIISMEITSKDSTSDRPFAYCQLLKETILCQDDESDLKKDMLAFCRIHYADNQEVVHEIDEFEKSFTDTHSIQWYTRHCFLTKILSRAFRTQEIDLLFKIRYFIQCLHKQIQSIAVKEPITTYAILDVEQETVRKFQDNINGLVLFRSFFSTTFERPTFMDYPNKGTQQRLVLSIRLGPGCAANIEQLRSSGCKIDVLINIDTVFRIISIDKGENGVPTVNLESVPHDDSHFQQLTAALREEMKAPVVILQLTKLLLETDHYREGDYLTELVYQDKSFENDGTLLASLAASHHLLGNANETKRDFEAARYQLFKSLRAFQVFLPYNHAMLSPSYNNVGSMFYQEDQHEYAIKFQQMALECQLKASNPDMSSVATYSANIGAVYIDQKNYTEAVKHLQRAAILLEKMSMKDNTKRLISILQKISKCFWHTKKVEEALEYYKKTLDLQLKLPDPSPHPLSVTYYNLSTAYARIGDYENAVACGQKSVDNLKMISEDHPELEENQAQLDIVRQKLGQKEWLKQVLSA